MRAIINNKIRALLLALCFGQAVSVAQTHQFSLDGDFMERGELRIGGNDTDPSNGKEDFAAFILGRVRLTADYQLLNEKGSPIMEKESVPPIMPPSKTWPFRIMPPPTPPPSVNITTSE